MFCEIGLKLNGQNVGDTSLLYPNRSHLESLLHFCKEVKETRLLCEGYKMDTTGHMGVTVVGGNNTGLNVPAATFAKSTVVDLIGRPHLDVFHQERQTTLCASRQRQVKVINWKNTRWLSRASLL